MMQQGSCFLKHASVMMGDVFFGRTVFYLYFVYVHKNSVYFFISKFWDKKYQDIVVAGNAYI